MTTQSLLPISATVCSWCETPFVPLRRPNHRIVFCSDPCRLARCKKVRRDWRRAHPDAARNWRSAHPEAAIKYSKKSRAIQPDLHRQWARISKLRREYGLTLEAYAALAAGQQHRCAICRQHEKKNLAVDHDHASGQIRGLLCIKCNLAIEAHQGDLAWFNRAAQYLKVAK